MIQLFRKFSQSLVAKVLFGFLIVAMGLFALQSNRNASWQTGVISAGDRSTTEAEFKRIFDDQRKSIEEREHRPITAEDLIQHNVHHDLANQMAERNAYLAWMDMIRLRPSDDLITAAMRRQPAFLNPVTGAFDKQQFQAALGRVGITEAIFQRDTRDELATGHFASGMSAGLSAPRIFGAMQASYELERRDISIFAVTPQMAGMPSPPTDAQLTQFINENKEQLRKPERRELTLVLFTPSTVASQVTVDPADVRRDYDARAATMATAERRTFVQIPINSAAAAQRVTAALRAGQDPAAVAGSVGVEAVTFTDKPQSVLPDPAVAQAVFALQPGQVSGLIRGQIKPAIVKLISVAPGHAVSFEEARPAIEARLKTEAAAEKVYDLVQKFEEARQAGKPMLQAAALVGAKVVKLPVAVTAQGLAPNGQHIGGANMTPVFEAGFALPPGGESDSTEDFGNGEYFAVKVDKVIPAGLPTIANDKAELSFRWMAREIDRRMRAMAEKLTARIRKGESVAAVAASVHGTPRTVLGLPRAPNQSLGPLVGEIFTQRQGEVFTGLLPKDPRAPFPFYAVGKVDAVHTVAPAIAARIVQSQQARVSQGLSDDMAQLAAAAARQKLKPKIRMGRIDELVGATPDTAAGRN
jgi:peptidyl-prolyl cis-trans isomerase D